MRITYKGDYALKTILDLSLHHGDEPVTIHQLAKRADIPMKFLEQILLELKRGGFVESRRGKIGGYFLARSPAKIRVGEVIRFIDGPIEPIACVGSNYRGCADQSRCALKGLWNQVALSTARIVDSVTFEDLIRRKKRLGSTFVYQI